MIAHMLVSCLIIGASITIVSFVEGLVLESFKSFARQRDSEFFLEVVTLLLAQPTELTIMYLHTELFSNNHKCGSFGKKYSTCILWTQRVATHEPNASS